MNSEARAANVRKPNNCSVVEHRDNINPARCSQHCMAATQEHRKTEKSHVKCDLTSAPKISFPMSSPLNTGMQGLKI